VKTLLYLTASFIVVDPCTFAVDERLFLSSFLAALAADLSPASRADAA